MNLLTLTNSRASKLEFPTLEFDTIWPETELSLNYQKMNTFYMPSKKKRESKAILAGSLKKLLSQGRGRKRIVLFNLERYCT